MIDLHLSDCLEVMRSMPDNSVDLIFTDPPYGHDNNNNGDLIHRWEAALGVRKITSDDARPIANDGIEANDLFRDCLIEYKRILKDRCCCCCCGGGGGPDPQFARWSLWMDEILNFDQMIVWDKGKIGMGWRYRRSYEVILVAHKGNSFRWYDNSKKVENIIRHIRKIIPNKNQHPTVKPVELARHFIELHTQAGDTVFDPFMGSGTTGVACVQTGRNFIGCEIDPNYFAIAQKRITEAQAQLELFNMEADCKLNKVER